MPIVGDALYGSGDQLDGRMVPALALDATKHPEVTELIRIHQVGGLEIGEAASQWGRSPKDADEVWLLLRFTRPIELELCIPFSIEHQGILVHLILKAEAAYLQEGQSSDNAASRWKAPKVLIEVGGDGFRDAWPKLLVDRMTAVFVKRGLRRSQASHGAREMFAELEKMANLRLQTVD